MLPRVAPYVGAWIETNKLETKFHDAQVAPYVGAWIETSLKRKTINPSGRTLRGCVD